MDGMIRMLEDIIGLLEDPGTEPVVKVIVAIGGIVLSIIVAVGLLLRREDIKNLTKILKKKPSKKEKNQNGD